MVGETPVDPKMHKVEAEVDVDVPISVAYDQWTQFEEFPRFMKAIDRVEQIDATHLHWQASISSQHKEWDAEIVEQVPDHVISWRSTSGTVNNGVVTFEVLAPGRCRVHLAMTYAPEGLAERAGSALGMLKAQVEADLGRFKRFIEDRASPTGAWRGEVHAAKQEPAGVPEALPAEESLRPGRER